MAVLHYKARVDQDGNLVIRHTDLPQGAEYEVALELLKTVSGEQANLRVSLEELGWLKLAESSMDFWDNPVDDEVWNNA